jgi:dienelactone hydrolase
MTSIRNPALALANEVSGQREQPIVAAPAPRFARRRGTAGANNLREDLMERIPQPIMDKRGEPHMKRFEDQRWVLDNIVRSNGIDWDQPRSIYISGPCGMEGQADIAVVRERVKKMADIAPAFEAVAVRREAKAKAAEETGNKVTARDNYFMSAVYWGAAQWPYDQNDEANVACHLKKRENYTKYTALADHKIEAAWIPFKDTALPAWFHLPPGYTGGKLPVIINVPGMDSYKEIQTALYGDRFLNRGFAVLNIDGPGQYESPMLGIYFSMDNWVATGTAVCDWLAKRPEVDMSKVVLSGTSFGTFFGTIATAHEPRISACAVISVCHEPGCHTIFQEASPTFKKRFMYMSGITDEAEFDKMRQGMTWEGHADKVKCPYLCVAGEWDELSPVEHSHRLVAAVKGPKRMVVYQESRHSVGNVPAANLGPFPPILVADWLADRVAGKPFLSEQWYVRSNGAIEKKPL